MCVCVVIEPPQANNAKTALALIAAPGSGAAPVVGALVAEEVGALVAEEVGALGATPTKTQTQTRTPRNVMTGQRAGMVPADLAKNAGAFLTLNPQPKTQNPKP